MNLQLKKNDNEAEYEKKMTPSNKFIYFIQAENEKITNYF